MGAVLFFWFIMIVTFALQADHLNFPVFPRTDILVASIRKWLPEAKIIQLSNADFLAAEDVDEVLRTDNNGDFIEWAFSSMIKLLERGEDVIQLATDIIVNGEIADVFNDDFDIACCRYPLHDRADGAFCGDVNFIKPSGIGMWRDALAYYQETPGIKDGWEGGQTAFLEVSKLGKYRIKELDYDTYCYTPDDFNEDVSKAKIVHFRGNRKGMMMYYSEELKVRRLYNPKVVCNVSDDALDANIDYALSLPVEILVDQYMQPKEQKLVIVGGGPSLACTIPEINDLKNNGAIVWALNNSFRYLCEHGVEVDVHVMLDARQENIAFIPITTNTMLLYSAQCHPDVLDKGIGTGAPMVIWCPSVANMQKKIAEKKIDAAIIAGGSSVGIKAMGLAKVFGFKEVYLYGYDSSYHEDKNHAYEQGLNKKERIIDVFVNDRKFKCAPWMATQANEFRHTVSEFVSEGMIFHVGGFGLLPYIAQILQHEVAKSE